MKLNLCKSRNIANMKSRIGNALNIDCLRLLVNGIFKIFRISSRDEFDANSMGLERNCTILA